MADKDALSEHLNPYERAVCYYTLPRITRPLTYGIIVAYAVCLLEAAAAAAYGLVAHKEVWLNAGGACLVGMIVFGMVVFSARTFLNELHQRRAIAQARGVPEPEDTDLPDPFAGHRLLRHPRNIRGHLYTCTRDDATPQYRVEESVRRRRWKIFEPEGTEVCEVRALSGPRSFSFGSSGPSHLAVYVAGERVAQVDRRVSFVTERTDIHLIAPEGRGYRVENRSIYHEDRLVGRIYYLRHSLYLDIEEEHLNPGTLAYYATML